MKAIENLDRNMAMSLDCVLEQERREVLALLEGQRESAPRRSKSSASSAPRRTSSPFTTPQSPVRSMLDIDGNAGSRRSSIASTNGGVTIPTRTKPIGKLDIGSTTPPTQQVRSMLDIDESPSPPALSQSAKTSPTNLNGRDINHDADTANNSQHRSMSDTGANPPVGLGRRTPAGGAVGTIPEAAYQFSGYFSSNPGGPVVPKRNTLGGKKSSLPSAMAEVMKGTDLSVFGLDRGRKGSLSGTGIGGHKSKSPHNRLGLRSDSPGLSPGPSKYVSENGKVVDMKNAYRRFSDANLARAGGALSALTGKGRRSSGAADGKSRLEKDYSSVDGEGAIVDSSDEDNSSDEERQRGRKQNSDRELVDDGPESQSLGMGRAKGSRAAKSLMAASEEERKEVATSYNVRSLLDPEITVTAPSGDRHKSGKSVVHPNTSFDEGASGLNTPVDSDTEADITDIKRAQKLSITMTRIMSTPGTGRSVRTLYRGDFAKMQRESQDNQRRVRKYLVATDLSDEAAHALEWTIGTVLRDGDTLLAIYCVDEELGIAPNDTSGDDAQMKEQAAAIVASTKPNGSTPTLVTSYSPSPLGQGMRLDGTSASASPAGRGRSKAEQERSRAVQDITDRVAKLLRKTKLQVKVVIEVIHCKSPRHLITEVIDYLSPTLVILGSRGRSALKGVILGSFSNYLVTKSSVPVMVARKRLRKHTKYRRPPMKMANNLSNPVKSLAAAKID